MPGILGTEASVITDIALISQIAILFILLLGYKYKKTKKLREHGLTMTIAVILHTVVILLVMVPSLMKNLGALEDITNTGVIITVVHAIMGILAVGLGFFLVSEWRFRPLPYMTCARRKVIMGPLLTIWVCALVLGVVFYMYYYF